MGEGAALFAVDSTSSQHKGRERGRGSRRDAVTAIIARHKPNSLLTSEAELTVIMSFESRDRARIQNIHPQMFTANGGWLQAGGRKSWASAPVRRLSRYPFHRRRHCGVPKSSVQSKDGRHQVQVHGHAVAPVVYLIHRSVNAPRLVTVIIEPSLSVYRFGRSD
ncbi:hypothetical protein J6590_047252 [Homalodisca vitripennis]|nr:hypothetical protein J6590_047252 [Homalodisca vitripennis]